MKKILFIDRDGTIIREPADEQIDSFDKLRFVSGVIRNLAFIREKLDFRFVMVSNQDGLEPRHFPKTPSGLYITSSSRHSKMKASRSMRFSLTHTSLRTMRPHVNRTRDWWKNT